MYNFRFVLKKAELQNSKEINTPNRLVPFSVTNRFLQYSIF